jgi:hypothetical protein
MNANMSVEEQTNKYNELIAMHVKGLQSENFIFEITKCCNYSTLVFMCKEAKLCDLFTRVAKHFECQNLVSLYLLDQNGNKITIPFNSVKVLKEFIIENTQVNNRIMKPIYDIPLPVVYRIYLDDGCHHDHA